MNPVLLKQLIEERTGQRIFMISIDGAVMD
jgi:hypothetical protein